MHVVHLDHEDLPHHGTISAHVILKTAQMEACKICLAICILYILTSVLHILANLCTKYAALHTSLKKMKLPILGWKNRVFCPLRFKSTYEIISAL